MKPQSYHLDNTSSIMFFIQWISPTQADEVFRARTAQFAPPHFSEMRRLQRYVVVLLLLHCNANNNNTN